MSKGILLIACGHPYYGRMAYNLAVSIKLASPGISITLCYAGRALDHLQKNDLSIFDNVDELNAKTYTVSVNGEIKHNWIRTKMFMYEISPYDKTIFLDVDMLWGRKPVEELFEQLNELEFTIQNRGSVSINDDDSKYFWAKLSHIKREYHFDETARMPLIHSEFVYFKRCAFTKKLFKAAVSMYDTCKVKPHEFAGFVCDELAIALAMMTLGVMPHKEPYKPVFWHWLDKADGLNNIHEIFQNRYAVSFGGAITTSLQKNLYNNLSIQNFIKSGRSNPWMFRDKKAYLSERIKI